MCRTMLMAGVGAAAILAAGATHAQAPTAPDAAGADVYTLGELVITARARDGEPAGGAVITGDELRRFDKVSVDQALDLIPGAAAGATGTAALPRERLTFDRHGDVRTYEGPLLLDVLARVGVPESPLRKAHQATAVLVEAADGYQVVFGLAETDPATRADRIIVADMADGEPLSPDHQGPFMIVAEGDVRAARSPRMVTAIRVIPLGTERP